VTSNGQIIEKMKLTIIYRIYYWKYLEAIIWIAGFIMLFIFTNLGLDGFTVCPLKLAGFDHCPGCGLGTAVGLLLNGQWQASLQSHILGIPAFLIISYRIFTILKQK